MKSGPSIKHKDFKAFDCFGLPAVVLIKWEAAFDLMSLFDSFYDHTYWGIYVGNYTFELLMHLMILLDSETDISKFPANLQFHRTLYKSKRRYILRHVISCFTF